MRSTRLEVTLRLQETEIVFLRNLCFCFVSKSEDMIGTASTALESSQTLTFVVPACVGYMRDMDIRKQFGCRAD